MNIKKVATLSIGVLAITAVILGSIHIYSTAVARKVLEQTLNGITIVGMAPMQRLENPARFTYQLDIKIANASRLTADVEILDWQVQIDETTFAATPINAWQATIHPREARDLPCVPRGQITIMEPAIIELKEKDIVPLVITGTIKVTARQAWVTETITHEFELESSVMFD